MPFEQEHNISIHFKAEEMGGFQFARQCCMKNGSDLQQTLSLQAPKFKAMFVKFTKILGYWSMASCPATHTMYLLHRYVMFDQHVFLKMA